MALAKDTDHRLMRQSCAPQQGLDVGSSSAASALASALQSSRAPCARKSSSTERIPQLQCSRASQRFGCQYASDGRLVDDHSLPLHNPFVRDCCQRTGWIIRAIAPAVLSRFPRTKRGALGVPLPSMETHRTASANAGLGPRISTRASRNSENALRHAHRPHDISQLRISTELALHFVSKLHQVSLRAETAQPSEQ